MKLHLRDPETTIEQRQAYCGWSPVSTTDDRESVSCGLCRKRMAADDEYARALRVPLGPSTSSVGEAGERALARQVRIDEGRELHDGPRWSSLEKAAEHWARVVDDGAPIRSCDPKIRVQLAFAGAPIVSGRDDVLGFSRALEQAFDRPRVFGSVIVPVELQRQVLEWRLAGKPILAPRDARQHHAEVVIDVRPEVERKIDLHRETDAEDGWRAARWATDERRMRESYREILYRPIAHHQLARKLGGAVSPECMRLVEHRKRAIVFEARIVSGESTPGRRRVLCRASRDAGTLADELCEAMRLPHGAITDHQIGVIVRDGSRRMREVMARAGELRPVASGEDREREERMPKSPHHDVRGWIAISLRVGLHETTCRKLAEREHDPLPVYDFFGAKVAKGEDLDAWSARQAKPGKAAGGSR